MALYSKKAAYAAFFAFDAHWMRASSYHFLLRRAIRLEVSQRLPPICCTSA